MGQKNSGGGGEGVVRWVNAAEKPLYWEHELPTMIYRYEANYEPVDYPEINKVVRTWFSIYHSLVLFAAAADPPDRHKIDPDRCRFDYPNDTNYYEGLSEEDGEYWLDDGHRVPAFDNEEAGCLPGQPGQNGGWIYSLIKEELAEKTREIDLQRTGRKFSEVLLQPLSISESTQQPALQYFHENFEALPSNFAKFSGINACRASIPKMNNSHSATNSCIEMALALLDKIWGDNLDSKLSQVREYPDVNNPSLPVGSKLWFEKRLGFQFTELDQHIKDLFDNNSDEVKSIKAEISLETTKLDINTRTYTYIYKRFEAKTGDETKEGLNEAIVKLSNDAAWENLLRAAHGAIAWQIFEQAYKSIEKVINLINANGGSIDLLRI